MADQLKATQKRNLLVLGRTGVGKSTVVNQILGKSVFSVFSAIESVTRETRTLEEEVIDEERRVEYKIKIIDTIGLHDQVVRIEDIKKQIKDYYSVRVPEGINLIFFITRKGIFTKEEKQIFEQIFSKFSQDIKEISALVITGCEQLDHDGRKGLIDKVQSDKDTQSFAEFMGKGIYPVGFPCVDTLKPALKEVYEEGIKTDAEKLRKVVWDSRVGMKNLFTGQQNTNYKRQFITYFALPFLLCVSAYLVFRYRYKIFEILNFKI